MARAPGRRQLAKRSGPSAQEAVVGPPPQAHPRDAWSAFRTLTCVRIDRPPPWHSGFVDSLNGAEGPYRSLASFHGCLVSATPAQPWMASIAKEIDMAGTFPTARRASRAWRVATVLLGAGLLSGLASPAWSDEEAMQLLKKTSDYMAKQQTISMKFDSDIEIVTPSLQKIQFASSGEALLTDRQAAPVTAGRLLGCRTGVRRRHGHPARQERERLCADAVHGRHRRSRGQAPRRVGRRCAGADLLLADMFKQMSADVLDGKHIGQGVVDGVECEHLAFRGPEVDWQLWVEFGSSPVPRKYVITSKMVAGAPQYTLRIKEWKAGFAAQPDAFAFRPGDAKRVEMKEAAGWDEVPPAVSEGKAR